MTNLVRVYGGLPASLDLAARYLGDRSCEMEALLSHRFANTNLQCKQNSNTVTLSNDPTYRLDDSHIDSSCAQVRTEHRHKVQLLVAVEGVFDMSPAARPHDWPRKLKIPTSNYATIRAVA